MPKKLLVTNVQRLLGSGRLKIADGLPEARTLQRELANFRVTITAKANETFAAGTHSGRDDLVSAVARAVWVANKCLDRESLQLDLHQ